MTRRTRPSLLLLALLLVVVALAPPAVRADPDHGARTGPVPRSICARYDHGIRDGVCVQDSRGGVYWLGTLVGYDGEQMYCIDYHFATAWGVAHRRFVLDGPLPTSTGGRVRPATTAALAYLVTRYRAGRVGDTTAAAIGLVIRQVMGDVRRPYGQTIPGGLTVDRQVRSVSFVGRGIVSRARELWAEARVHRGPWSLAVFVAPGADRRVSPGEKVVATVRARNGSGGAQDATVRLSYTRFSGPASVRLGSDGVARLTLTAPATPGAAKVAARVTDTPGARPVLVRPLRWRANPHPGRPSTLSQRGLVGRMDAVQASAAALVEVHYGPVVTTRTSQAEVLPGAQLTDELVITGADPAYTGPVTVTLHGPFAERPGAGSCAPANAVGTVTVPVHGDGTYRTPPVTVPAVGWFTWVASLPATPSQDAVRTPCGVAEETTLATAQPRVVTRTSDELVEVGASISDTVTVTGTAPGHDAVATARLYGPFPALAQARCTGAPYAQVTFRVRGDGTYRTSSVRLGAAGVYTWVETMPADDLTRAVSTRCGVVAETTTARRTPPVPSHPSVPAGGAGWLR